MNIDAKPEEVVTSALAQRNYISDEKSDATVYMLGQWLTHALTEARLTVKR